jgi:hypothetical protein
MAEPADARLVALTIDLPTDLSWVAAACLLAGPAPPGAEPCQPRSSRPIAKPQEARWED